ncbi:hypothetical protein PproGo58_49440 [Pseudomonas protegens]|nr:hypothetical protein PproGo58_49440 [Pseudomonas protegens]
MSVGWSALVSGVSRWSVSSLMSAPCTSIWKFVTNYFGGTVTTEYDAKTTGMLQESTAMASEKSEIRVEKDLSTGPLRLGGAGSASLQGITGGK